jgi:hypothetical protein
MVSIRNAKASGWWRTSGFLLLGLSFGIGVLWTIAGWNSDSEFGIITGGSDPWVSTLSAIRNHHQEGWKSIDVFYGNEAHLRLGKSDRSQCDQDKLVVALLRNLSGGYFVDLAANDATDLSNTFQLEQQHHWNGICVEPNPRYWRKLTYRRCHLAAAVVGKTRMEQVQFKLHDGSRRAPSGGIEGLGFDNDPNKPKTKDPAVSLYTVPVQEILERYRAPPVMEYLSLDIEGAEYFVMKDFPFTTYRFKIMTIERPSQELVNLLYSNQYVYLAANNEYGMETLWVHRDHLSELDTTAIEAVKWRTVSTRWIEVGTSPAEKPRVIAQK